MRVFVFLLLAGALAGCSNVSTHRNPAVDLSRYQKFFVERRLGDDRHVDEQIVAELRKLGREASSGPLTMKPDGTDAVVSYTDRWEWDFKDYLIELKIDIRDARNGKPLTTGRYYQPSLTARNPPAMIREILGPSYGSPGKTGGQ